ncbi:major facilitator superfamily protein [Hirsutella rhossiliensis]|uniref:Major facilitator superfamily domain-containing protein n=1 Tax=Hirsutella rhossiliensis TaxID=111463 RepID=A0A9P8N6J1_9HYPO|nr:major facilitator superfamily domain-containing protein [Hirsutella rhossiliensis]KAH0967892.1 major facilitator superfamily domain-containing protein [Hirsutella rhossiliensis]
MSRSSGSTIVEDSQSHLDGPEHPPGTVELLLSKRKSEKEGELTLVPTPTDDPRDPLAWPMWRKCLNFGLLSTTTMALFTGLSIQHIFWAPMRKDLNVTYDDLMRARAAQLGSEAIACVIFIPFAKKYGRRPVYIVSTITFTAASWWSAYMKTVPEIFLSNILKGIAAAVNETAVQMSVRDMFFVNQRGSANAVYLAALKFGTALSPIAAGAQAAKTGWRSSYITLSAIMTVVTLLFAATFEETKFIPRAQAGVGEKSRPSDDGLHTGDGAARVGTGGQKAAPSSKKSLWRTMYNPIHVWWMPHILAASWIYGSSLALVIILSSMKSIVFPAPPYNFNPGQLGLLQLAPFIGSCLGIFYGGYLVDRVIVYLAKRNRGLFEPEMRLYLMPLPAVIMAGGLAVFGITASRGMHWIYPCIGSAMTSFGFGALGDMVLTCVIDAYPNIVSLAFVAIAFFRNTLSMIGTFGLGPWRESMSVENMFIIMAVVSLVINLSALPLVIWGKKARIATAARYYRLATK